MNYQLFSILFANIKKHRKFSIMY